MMEMMQFASGNAVSWILIWYNISDRFNENVGKNVNLILLLNGDSSGTFYPASDVPVSKTCNDTCFTEILYQ